MSIIRRPVLKHPDAWEKEKLVTWSKHHRNPFIRVPLPSGKYVVRTVKDTGDEWKTFKACQELRDRLGVELWGKHRWSQIMASRARSTAKFHKTPATEKNGVNHYAKTLTSGTAVATWYEPVYENGIFTGKRKKRSKAFGYGGRAQCQTKEEAMEKAITLREEKERECYSVSTPRHKAEVNP